MFRLERKGFANAEEVRPAVVHNPSAMTDRDFKALIDRFDRHLVRIDEHMVRQERVIERNTQVVETTVAAIVAVRHALDDMRDEIQSNTRAVLNLLDRFEGPGEAT